jgi:hypothetical protein
MSAGDDAFATFDDLDGRPAPMVMKVIDGLLGESRLADAAFMTKHEAFARGIATGKWLIRRTANGHPVKFDAADKILVSNFIEITRAYQTAIRKSAKQFGLSDAKVQMWLEGIGCTLPQFHLDTLRGPESRHDTRGD